MTTSEDGRLVSTSSHCTKIKVKCPRYRRCHLELATSFGAKVCVVVIRVCDHVIEGLPKPLPN